MLLLGWIVSYADRTLTGPVIAWMIQNKAGFIGDAANPATLGGLVGSMFFLGYMLTQYPGGRLGDRFGHREMIIVSLLAACVLTFVSGLMAGLVAFVAARVLTGLGEGVFYSNDRTLIINHTPVEKRTLGLGIVITGLSIGLTFGIIFTPITIDWGTSLGMGGEAWRMPFFVFSAFTFVILLIAFTFFRAKLGGALRLGPPLLRLLAFSAPTFVVIVALFLLAETLRWPEWLTAAVATLIALVYVAVIVRSVQRSGRGRHCSTATSGSFTSPTSRSCGTSGSSASGRCRSSRRRRRAACSSPRSRRRSTRGQGSSGSPRVAGWPTGPSARGAAARCWRWCAPVVYSVLVLIFGWSISGGDKPSLALLGLLLFSSGLFFNALQPIVQGMTGDMVPAAERGSAFGMLNLISEIGAVLSPVVSGILRDATGSWAAASSSPPES